MPMMLDGADIIRRIIDHPHIFPLASEINEIAQKLVLKRLKATKISLDEVRAVCSTLGEQHFKLIADNMSGAELKSLIGKIDKSNSEVKSGQEALQRAVLIELATGRVEPLKAVLKKAAEKKTKTPKNSEAEAITQALDSRAMQARRRR